MSDTPLNERAPRATLEFELPHTGRKIKLREPNGSEELQAQTMSRGDATKLVWAQLMLATVEIDGQPVDQSSLSPDVFRDRFSTSEFAALRVAFMEHFYKLGDEDELATFLAGIRVGAG